MSTNRQIIRNIQEGHIGRLASHKRINCPPVFCISAKQGVAAKNPMVTFAGYGLRRWLGMVVCWLNGGGGRQLDFGQNIINLRERETG